MKLVFDLLMADSEPLDQTQISEQSGVNKGSISRALTPLTQERFQGQPFVQMIDGDRRTYWVNDFIKAEVRADY